MTVRVSRLFNALWLLMLNREGGAYEALEDSQEYENQEEPSHYAWMVPCMFPSAL